MSDFRPASAVFFGLLLVLLLPAPRARAADPTELESLIRQGVEQRQKGHDQAALPFFKRAYDLEPSPRTAAQLGLAELSLGYALAAERHLGEALSSPHHLWVQKNRKNLEAALAEAQKAIGAIEVTGEPAGAEVLVNGELAGTLPLASAVPVVEGTVQVVVRSAGFDEQITKIKIAGGAREHLTIALARTVSAQAPASITRSSKTPRSRIATAGQLTQSAQPAFGAPGWVRPTAYVFTGVGLLALGFGAYELLRTKQNLDAFNSAKRAGTSIHECDTSFPNNGSDSCSKHYNDAISAQKLGLAGLQAGGLLGAMALVGFLWSANHAATESASHAALTPTLGGFAAMWQARF